MLLTPVFLSVYILDKTKEIWWKKLFTHENDIDVSKIDCSRPIDELSDENQAQIHQIEYDEQQKLKGTYTKTPMIRIAIVF